jgi:ferritin-like metal-binding protein YciE
LSAPGAGSGIEMTDGSPARPAANGERTLATQLIKYLTDVHCIERQAAAQVRRAPALVSDPRLADAFRAHIEETAGHERSIREALSARGERPSRGKDAAGVLGGWGMVLFARLNPDTPGKLVAHAHSYEHMEEAAYELLARVARRADDEEVAELAGRIAAQERAMADRLVAGFGDAVAALREKGADNPAAELVAYLRDAHAIESQAQQFLPLAARLIGAPGPAAVLRDHLAQTREQRRLLRQRLDAHGAAPSRLQDAALRAGALNLGAFFAVQPDTPIKVAGFAYAFEHLEVAAYGLLGEVAQRAGDAETAAVAARILDEERDAAQRISAGWDEVVDTTLDRLGLAA